MMSPQDAVERWVSWHGITTIALAALVSILTYLVVEMRDDIRFVNGEVVRQDGVDKALRQQVDINTVRINTLIENMDKMNLDHSMRIERLFSTQDLILHGHWSDKDSKTKHP